MKREIDLEREVIKANKIKKNKKLKKILGYISKIGEISSILVHINKKPSKLHLFSIGLGLSSIILKEYSNSLNEKSHTNSFDVFYSSRWTRLAPSFLASRVSEVINNKSVYYSDDTYRAIKANVENFMLGWVERIKGGNPMSWVYFLIDENDSIEIITEKKKKLETLLSKKIWQTFNSDNLILKRFSLEEEYSNLDSMVETNSITSLFDRVKKFVENDISRSYLIEGKPGLGKSTAITYIVKKLGLKSLRVDMDMFCSEVSKNNNDGITLTELKFIIECFRPDIVIIDDIDRISVKSHPLLFSMLEKINQNSKILFATINDKNKFPEALLRPGRFDEHHNFSSLKREIVEHIVGSGEEEKILSEMEKFPIAYLVEYSKRKKILGKEVAINEIDELRERIEKSNNQIVGQGNKS